MPRPPEEAPENGVDLRACFAGLYLHQLKAQVGLRLWEGMLALEVDPPATALLEDAVRYAAEVVLPWSMQNPNPKNFWMVSGPVGTGKSTAALRVANYACRLGVEAALWKLVDWLTVLKGTYHTHDGETAALLAGFRDVSVLVIDDIGAGQGDVFSVHDKGRLEEVLIHRYDFSLPTVLVTNLSARSFTEALGARLMSRLHQACYAHTRLVKNTPDFRRIP